MGVQAVWHEGPDAVVTRSRRIYAVPASSDLPINPWRITIALDSRGLDGPEVDEALGGCEPMVDDWERGKGAPTEHQLALLAELTRYPTAFFLDWDDPPGRDAPVFACRDIVIENLEQE